MKMKSETQKKAGRIAYTLGLAALLSYGALADSKENFKENNELVEENNEILNRVNNSINATSAGVIAEMSKTINNDQYTNTNAGVISVVGDHLNDAIYNIKKSEYEKQADKIGEKVYNIKLNDTFTIKDNANIYENEYDAALKENGKTSYFDKNTKRNVESIIYEYNGTKILLDENDPDFEATKQALESNGAVPVAIGSENEYNVGYEGFYNIDDVNIEGRRR